MSFLHHLFIVLICLKKCLSRCLFSPHTSCYCCFAQQDSEEEEEAEVTLTLEQGPQEHDDFQHYIPEDFANFEIYNATLESGDGFLSSHCDFKRSRCGGGSRERELSRSPTASSCTSGYFSHSASNATLSDLPFSASESSDHLSCTSRDLQDQVGCPAAKSCVQTKCVSTGSDAQQSPLSAAAVHHRTSPVSIPSCKDMQETLPLPSNCVLSTSQEFTDFKGADDSIGQSDLSHFTQQWEQDSLERKPDNVETRGNQRSSHNSAVVNMSYPKKASTALCKCLNNEEPVVIPVSCPNTPVVLVRAPVTTPDKAPSTALISPPASGPLVSPSAISATPPAPASVPLRAGGDPPIQEPAQGDLPHGSPCPSPNPSSAEPSGDSSGDESTPAAQLPDWMAPGEQVWVGKRRGTVHYVGGVEFAKGIWIGVKLDMAVGKSLEGIYKNMIIYHD